MRTRAPCRHRRSGMCLVGLFFVALFVFLVAMFSVRTRMPGQALVQQAEPERIAGIEGPKGYIRASCGLGGELTLRRGDDDATSVHVSTNGLFEAAPGRYRLWYYTCHADDDDGASWLATSGLGRRDSEAFDLAEGETRVVSLGPPFAVRVRVRERPGERLDLDLQVTDAAGDGYRIRRATGQTPNPTFTITDATGRIVERGTFEYG